MRTLLLGFAAAAAMAVAAAPAGAQSGTPGPAPGGTAFSEGSSVAQHRDRRRHDRRHDRRHGQPHHRSGDAVVVMEWDAGEWAAWNNQGWRSDSFNDWWHDRPDRAYPRWLQNNQDCQRLWWGGGAWRC